MTPHQIQLVQSTWKQVIPISGTAATIFYNRLFEIDPQLRGMFSDDLTEQKRKLMQMIGIAVAGLNDLATIVPAVQALGQRHVSYGVKDEHYAVVGAALLWTLEAGLGPAFTPEVKNAWSEVYGVLAETMKSAAAKAA